MSRTISTTMNKWYKDLVKIENGYYLAINDINKVGFPYECCIYDMNGGLVDKLWQYAICYRKDVCKHCFLYYGLYGVIHSLWDRETSDAIYYYIKYDEDE